jgi:hypothetical protein
MNVAEAVRDMVARGLTHEHALIAIEVFKKQKKARTEAKLAHKREMDRARQQRLRSRVVTRDVRDDEGSSVTSVTRDKRDAEPNNLILQGCSVTPVTRDRRDTLLRARGLSGSKSKTSSSPSPFVYPPSSLRSSDPQGGDDTEKRKNGKRLDPAWTPADVHRTAATKLGLSPQELEGIAEEFRNYWLALPGQKARKLDWGRTFTNRMNEQVARKQQQKGNGHGRPQRRSLIEACREDLERHVQPEDGDDVCGDVLRLLQGGGSQ